MFGINVLLMLLPKQVNREHSLMPRSNQGCGGLIALEELMYLLHVTIRSHRDSHASETIGASRVWQVACVRDCIYQHVSFF